MTHHGTMYGTHRCTSCQTTIDERGCTGFYYCPECRVYFCRACIASTLGSTVPKDPVKEDYAGYMGKSSSPQTVLCPRCSRERVWFVNRVTM
jgi:ribosomal protein L37AE/L43A